MSHGSAYSGGRHIHSAGRHSCSLWMAGAPGRGPRRPRDSRESTVGMLDVPVRCGTRDVRDALPFAQLVHAVGAVLEDFPTFHGAVACLHVSPSYCITQATDAPRI